MFGLWESIILRHPDLKKNKSINIPKIVITILKGFYILVHMNSFYCNYTLCYHRNMPKISSHSLQNTLQINENKNRYMSS